MIMNRKTIETITVDIDDTRRSKFLALYGDMEVIASFMMGVMGETPRIGFRVIQKY